MGILDVLTKNIIWVTSLVWLFILLVYVFKTQNKKLHSLKEIKVATIFRTEHKDWIVIVLFTLLMVQALINLIGALGPELAFDALWYHLTLPKFYLLHNMIYHIPGGLLYYSDMPKLGEMLYTGALSFGNEIFPKLIHSIFGILTAIVLFKLSQKFFNRNISLLIVVIFYSNLVVDWESITAYIDLIRTFFELLALWGLLNWYESQKYTWLIVSALMIGLEITTKLLAMGSFFILLLLCLIISFIKGTKIKNILIGTVIYAFCTFIIPLPWFIFSYFHTGNPVFPFFTKTYEISASSPNPALILSDLWNLFIHSADPISPIYLIFLPLLFIFYSKFTRELKIIIWYSGLSLVLWYFTPRTGGGRFILPYLPAFSIICGAIYSEIIKKKDSRWKYTGNILLLTIIFISCISIMYRGIANKRYIPVILGLESKQKFLSNNLNYHYGDFYDTDNYFVNHIKPTDSVLLYGFHNLYYVNFPFIDSSWLTKGDMFNFVATQNTKLPVKYRNWQLVYSNDKTMVQLYKPPKGICSKLCRF
ncbi:MAG TPA: glycosyltransferase family 39 protein [Verrucomicrobiae bacterium]|nr:glycosyltransferase family 39 protein [Verrucomicrobiae bacterium]